VIISIGVDFREKFAVTLHIQYIFSRTVKVSLLAQLPVRLQ